MNGRRVDVPHAYPSGPPGPMTRRLLSDGSQLILREASEEPDAGLMPFGAGRRSASLMFVPIRQGLQQVEVAAVVRLRGVALDGHHPRDLLPVPDRDEHERGRPAARPEGHQLRVRLLRRLPKDQLGAVGQQPAGHRARGPAGIGVGHVHPPAVHGVHGEDGVDGVGLGRVEIEAARVPAQQLLGHAHDDPGRLERARGGAQPVAEVRQRRLPLAHPQLPGEVAGGDQDSRDAAVGAAQRQRREGEGEHDAVAPGLPHLVPRQGLSREEAGEQLRVRRRRLHRPEVAEPPAEQLFHRIAEDSGCGRIEEAEPALAVERPDQVAGAVAHGELGPVVQHRAHATGASASGLEAWSRRVRTRRPSMSTTSSVRVPIGTRSPGRGRRPI